MITIKTGDNKILSHDIYRNIEYKLWYCGEFKNHLKHMISNYLEPLHTVSIGIRTIVWDQIS